MTDQTGFELVCAAREAVLDADAREVVIVPAGNVESKAGRFIMDRVAADLTIAEYRKHGADLPIDVDHQTVYARDGQPAPAVGWIKDLAYRDHVGLLGTVEWTDDGRDAIRSGRFRYLSPVIAVRKSDGRVAALHSAAITTKPAIPNMLRLAASETVGGFLHALSQDPPPAGGKDTSGDPIDGGDGPGPNPGPAQAAAAPKTAALIRDLLAKLRDLLGLDKGASMQDVHTAIGEFIEAASAEQETDTAAMRERIRAEVTQEREVEDLLVHYSRQNKLHPKNETVMRVARSLAGRDLDTFRTLMDSLPSAVPPGRTTPPTPEQVQQHTVTRDARTEFQTHRAELSKFTDEAAFIAMRLRERGLTPP